MYKLYGIPNCDTVKKARTFLEKKKLLFDFIDFKKTPPTKDQLLRWQAAFGGMPINVKGATFKKHHETFEALATKDQFDFLTKNSSMIKRPILEMDGQVLTFGFDEDQYKKILKA